MLSTLVPKIQTILDKQLPDTAFKQVFVRTKGFGSDYISIKIAASDHQINNVRGQYPLCASLQLHEDLSLTTQPYGGHGGRRIYFKVLPEDNSFYALHSVDIPFRKPKPEEKYLLKAIERFASRWLQAIKDNADRLPHENNVDYPSLIGDAYTTRSAA